MKDNFSQHAIGTKTISLALQGGGAHGAFTWGVLDRLLEDERLIIEEISGTSAGAINPARTILLESASFWTGFDAVFLGPQLAQALNIRQRGGLLVQRVAEESMAGRAGLTGGTITATLLGQDILLGGDVVLSIYGTSCENPHDFARIREELDKLQDGNPFFINIVRGGKEVTLTGLVDRSSLSTRIRR